MNLSALPTLIAAGESQTLEFKTSLDNACIATLVAFTQKQPALPDVGASGGVGSEKSSEKILHHLRAEPKLSAKALAEKLGFSSRAVEEQIDLLKKEGRLRRIGPAKGGHWEVIE